MMMMLIPTTPPNGTLKHGGETSKEESLIISLQTQLALKTELCGHYGTDLKARDEVVEILGKKLANLEKDDTQRKNTLRSWKKKVQELERLCRQLEERDEVSLDESKARVDLLVRAKAEADVEINASRDRIVELQEEVERLRRHVHGLQQESADKEVKIVQMMKQHSLDKEDLQGLNIALDSKQQELQLVRFFSILKIFTYPYFHVAEEEIWC
jgi:chromosome segregation ATPase